MATLILSDGTRSIDFLSASGFKVPQDGINLPVVSREDTFAEGSDSEGRSRVRSRATNSTAGQISLYLSGATASALWTTIDNLQELVESAHLNKGSISYLGPGASSTVTYDLESISLTDLPQVGIELTQLRCNATITFESKPYGRLPTQRLNVQDTYQEQVTALSPSIFLPLGATAGLTDLSGNARNGTAAGGVTVGGATGPLAVDDGGATDFDGSNDYISTTYTTRRNLTTNPNFETNTTSWTAAGATVATSTDGAYDGTKSAKLTATGAYARISSGDTTISATAGLQHTVSAYIYNSINGRNGAVQAYYTDSGGSRVGSTVFGASTSLTVGMWTRVTASLPAAGVGTVYVSVAILTDNDGVGSAADISYIDAILVEQSATVGTYFPTVAQLASGEAAFTGTADASTSGVGCFINNATRTFMGWAKRDTTSGYHCLFGGSGATAGVPVLWITTGASQTVRFYPDVSGSYTDWSAAWYPGVAQWVHWALVFNEATDQVSLYINGVLQSTQTNTGTYSAFAGSFEIDSRGQSEFFDGKQAWVSVHQTALTATQIRDCYDAGKAQITLDGPIDSFVVSGVPGQVPALPVITLDDASTQARNIVEVGVQNSCDPNNLEPLLLQSMVDISVLGGASNTRAGSYSTNIIRAALTTTATAVCYSGSQQHDGLWKVRARVYPSATTVLVRLAWRAGDGPFAKEKWVQVPGSAGWFDLDLGTINLGTFVSGQAREFRIEGKTTSGVPTVDVDILELIPADSYTKLRGSTVLETSSGGIVAVDDFSTQTAGALSGKTPLLAPSGTWAESGDVDDFTVDATNKWAYRSAISDADLNTGQYIRCGSGVLAATTVSVDINASPLTPTGVRYGALLRYVDTNNWLMAVIVDYLQVSLIKRVAGTVTTLATAANPTVGTLGTWKTLVVSADASGNCIVYFGERGGTSTPIITVLADANLATGGAIDDGGYGMYDATTASDTGTRYYDNLAVSTLATSASIINPAINSGYGLDLKHNTALTDNSAGTSVGTTPIRQGNYPKLPPATRNTSKSRIVVRARRNDNDLGLADTGTSDALRASLTVTPRVHLTGT